MQLQSAHVVYYAGLNGHYSTVLWDFPERDRKEGREGKKEEMGRVTGADGMAVEKRGKRCCFCVNDIANDLK